MNLPIVNKESSEKMIRDNRAPFLWHRLALRRSFKSGLCNISNARSVGRSLVAVFILFCGLCIVLTSEFSFEVTLLPLLLLLLLLLLLWCFFTFLISIVKSEVFPFSSACFTKIKRILKIPTITTDVSVSVTKYLYNNYYFLILHGGWENLHYRLVTRENSELTVCSLYSSIWERERERERERNEYLSHF